jgi:ParB family chromosome partitioning protein
MTKKAVLGKGLDALLGGGVNVNVSQRAGRVEQPQHVEVPDEEPSRVGILEVSVDDIQANPDQPRTHFDEEALRELAESIKTLGLIQPITVREIKAGHYQIISGERRFRAARLAGLAALPVYVRTVDDAALLELALVENLQREDLDALEVALSFQRLMDECALTQEALSERIGKKRATVANYLRLLTLPAEIQVFIRDRKLSMGHARALAGVNDEKFQQKIARKVIDEDLSVRKVEELVKKHTTPTPSETSTGTPAAAAELPENYFQLIELLGSYFNHNVNVKRNEKGEGSITIHFNNDEEISHFLQKLNEQHI